MGETNADEQKPRQDSSVEGPIAESSVENGGTDDSYHSVDSDALVIDEGKPVPIKAEVTEASPAEKATSAVDEDDDEMPPALDAQPRADELEQVPQLTPEKESTPTPPTPVVNETSNPSAVPAPSAAKPTVPFNVTNLVPVKMPASSIAGLVPSSASVVAPNAAPVKKRAPRPKKAPTGSTSTSTPTTAVSSNNTQKPIAVQMVSVNGQQMAFDPASNSYFTIKKPVLPPTTSSNKAVNKKKSGQIQQQQGQPLMVVQPSMAGFKPPHPPTMGMQQMGNRPLMLMNGYVAVSRPNQPYVISSQHSQMLQMRPPTVTMPSGATAGPKMGASMAATTTPAAVPFTAGSVHCANIAGRLFLKGPNNQILSMYPTANGNPAFSTMNVVPTSQAPDVPPQLSPHASAAGVSGSKSPRPKKRKLDDPTPSSSILHEAPRPPQVIASQSQFIVPQLHKLNPHQLAQLKGLTPVTANVANVEVMHVDTEDKPPTIEKETGATALNVAKAKQTFLKEANNSQRFQRKPKTITHKIGGYVIYEEVDETSDNKAFGRRILDKPLQNYILSPQTSAPPTPAVDVPTTKGKSTAAKTKTPTKDASKQAKKEVASTAKPKLDSKIKKTPLSKVRKPVGEASKIPTKVEKPAPAVRKPTEVSESAKRTRLSNSSTVAPTTATPAAESTMSKRKNREVEGLLNMDFGPGNTPFETTSVETFTEKILTNREQLQKHTQAEERAVRAPSTTRAQSRRSVDKKSTTSSQERPPRRAAFNNRKRVFEEEEEDDESVDDDEDFVSDAGTVADDNASGASVPKCYFCHKPTTNSKLPQYCNKTCRLNYRRKMSLERTVREKCSNAAGLNSADNTGLEHSESSSNSSPPPPTKQSSVNQTPMNPTTSHSSPTSANEGSKASKATARKTAVAPTPRPPSSQSIASKDTPKSANDSNDSLNSSRSAINDGGPNLVELKRIPMGDWTTEQVARWAYLVTGSEKIGAEFMEQEMDGDALIYLHQQKQFRSAFTLKLGPAVKLERELVNTLNEQELSRVSH